jgi:hypothetical protein
MNQAWSFLTKPVFPEWIWILMTKQRLSVSTPSFFNSPFPFLNLNCELYEPTLSCITSCSEHTEPRIGFLYQPKLFQSQIRASRTDPEVPETIQPTLHFLNLPHASLTFLKFLTCPLSNFLKLSRDFTTCPKLRIKNPKHSEPIIASIADLTHTEHIMFSHPVPFCQEPNLCLLNQIKFPE